MKDMVYQRSASALLSSGADNLRSNRFLAAILGLIALATISCNTKSTVTGVNERPELTDAVLAEVGGDQQEGTVGAPAPEPLVARVVAANGDPIPGAPVRWTFMQGQGIGTQSGAAADQLSGTTNAEGLTEVEWTLGTEAGQQQATVEIVLPSASVAATTSSVDGTAPANDSGRMIGFTASAQPAAPDDISLTPESAEVQPGVSLQLEAEVLDPYGNQVPDQDVDLQWSSSDKDVAVVDGSGRTTAVSEGSAEISARAGPVRSTAMLVVSTGADPVADRIEVSPPVVSLEAGQTQQLSASAFDADGDLISTLASDYTWSSSNAARATVSPTGLVRGVTEGSATITAALDGRSAESDVTVRPGGDYGEWDFVLEDTLVVGDVVVPDGQVWLIGANVEVEGNVIVRGTLAMRPGGSLRFLGADPDQYVGGGLTFGPEFSDDIGLWVTGEGVLDIQGTPKQGWNRTGTHSTWEPGDEYWIAPTEYGDATPERWVPGDPTPRIDPRVPATEVVNVTRDIVIEGPGHIHIHSQNAQRIEYVRIEGMGVLVEGGPVLGRYALHLHVSGDGTRGTIIQGVALVNSKGRGFVPHSSHGITMIDNVAVNTWADAFWWDVGDDTNDLLVDRMAIVGVGVSRDILGETPRFDAFTLGSGINMEIRNSVAAGVCCNKLSVGFDWVSGGQAPNPIWIFDTGNVAHNNTGPGVRFWTNLFHEHPVRDFVSYNNDEGGVENGAYRNRVTYEDVVLINDHFHQQANSDGGPPQLNERIVIDSPREAIRVGHRKLPPDGYNTWIDCELSSGAGYPLVFVTDAVQPWYAHFIRCGITPDDIEFQSYGDTNRDPDVKGTEGSRILIDHEDGRKWEIRIENNQRIVVPR